MQIDLHLKAIRLLEKIANSIYERYPHNHPNIFSCFTKTEVDLVEEWLKNFVKEQQE